MQGGGSSLAGSTTQLIGYRTAAWSGEDEFERGPARAGPLSNNPSEGDMRTIEPLVGASRTFDAAGPAIAHLPHLTLSLILG